MEKYFLQYLDEKQKKWIVNNKIENRRFIDYTVLESKDLVLEESFFVAKSRKSRILLMRDHIWVDLTDYDLISLFCKMDEDTVKQLLCDLKAGYKDSWAVFHFQIDSHEFEGYGIDYDHYALDRGVLLEADFSVKLQDILFIFNMILYKDIVGENYKQKKLANKLIETTIMKYISLILYYKYDAVAAKQYLKHIKYPLCEWNDLLKNKMKMKKYDKCFEKNGFEKLLDMC